MKILMCGGYDRAIEHGCKAVRESLAPAWQQGQSGPLQDRLLQSRTAWALLAIIKAPKLACCWGGHDVLQLLSHQARSPPSILPQSWC